jgi:hypothetical protein
VAFSCSRQPLRVRNRRHGAQSVPGAAAAGVLCCGSVCCTGERALGSRGSGLAAESAPRVVPAATAAAGVFLLHTHSPSCALLAPVLHAEPVQDAQQSCPEASKLRADVQSLQQQLKAKEAELAALVKSVDTLKVRMQGAAQRDGVCCKAALSSAARRAPHRPDAASAAAPTPTTPATHNHASLGCPAQRPSSPAPTTSCQRCRPTSPQRRPSSARPSPS